jgi:hypothetical protein
MKTRTIISLAVSLFIVGLAAMPYLIHRSLQSRIGPEHIFELSERPAFLTEELALAKARETMTGDGLDLTIWQIQRDGRTFAPDGRVDEFAARNTINSNHVVFAFTNGSTSTRFVSVELAGSRVICQSSLGK